MAGEAENDDIRSLLQGAMDGKITAEGSGAAPPEMSPTAPASDAQPKAPTAETPAVPPSDRGDGRDAQGRFAGKPGEEKPRETLTLKPADPAKPETPAADQPQTPAAAAVPQQSKPPVPPPAWFKGAGKVDWNKMPDPVRAELTEFVTGLEAERAELAPMKELIDTNREFLVNEAGSMPEAFRRLIHLAKLSTTVDGAINVAQYVLQQRGIDPRQAFGGQPSQPGSQPQQPDLASLVDQRVNALLQPFQAQLAQREDQQHISTIQEFAANPAHPYFNDVRVHMGHLLKSGQAKTLDEAYDQATWAHPVIRQTFLMKQAEDAATTRAAEVSKAQLASQASLTGSPTPGAISSVQTESDGSIRGDLMMAMRQQTGVV